MEHFTPITVEVTFTDVDPALFRILTGLTVLELLPTPQNRDVWRRQNLTEQDPK